MQICDGDTKLLEYTPRSKHRGLNRMTWSMHLDPPIIPPGAQALFSAAQGPRVMPGNYTVKLIKGDQTYTGKLTVVLDPRAKYNVQDRKAQYDLSLKLRSTISHMSFAVANIENVRDAATRDAAKLPQSDALRGQLQSLATQVDELRSKIVATKEGGMITGEERIREHAGELYGYVQQYEGRPTDYQVERADSISRELEDVINDFNKLAQAQLPAVNPGLQKHNMPAITLLNEKEWIQQHASSSGGAGKTTTQIREID